MEITNDNGARKTKRLTSVVWNYFERVKKADAQYAICSHCKKKLSGSSNSGTTHLRNHLLRCLKRSNYDVSQILSAKRKRKETIQSPVRPNNIGVTTIDYEEGKVKDEILSPIPLNFVQGPKKQEICQSINLGSLKFDQNRSQMDLARMIMLHGYSLTMVDHVGFQVFVKNLQPLFDFKDYGAMELDCLTIYSKEKQKLYVMLEQISSRINLSVGMWDSSEGSDILCLTANYIDEDWRSQKKMLNFTVIEPSITDDFLHGAVIKSLTEWGIDRKLFSVTFDGFDADELMVSNIKDWLAQSRTLLKNGELFDMRSVEHLLKSISQEVTESCHEIISKVRDIVTHVKSSGSLLSKFKAIAEQVGISDIKHLVLDSPAQCDSAYVMLRVAIDYRNAVSVLKDHNSSSYSKSLSDTEWEWASSVAGFLKIVLECTNTITRNKHPTANIIFPEIFELHLQFIKWCKSPDDFLNSVALKMKYKFDMYWNKCSLVLAISTVLDPRFKMKLVEYYFQQIYGSSARERILEVSTRLSELFDEYYSGSSSDQNHHESLLGFRDKLEGFDKFLSESSSQSHNMSSELEKYLAEAVFPRNYDFNILYWWKVNTPKYPILSRVARDVLSIPVLTTHGSESAFGKKSHSSLSPDTREALMCGQD